jgi:hypothetical protein
VKKVIKGLAGGIVAIGLATLLGACSLFGGSGVDRDEDGNISGSGELDAFNVVIGDCFFEPEDETFSSLPGVPCTQAHDGEYIHKFDIDLPAFDKSAITEAAKEECLAAANDYIGPNWQDLASVDVGYFTPTSGSWGKGDREIACYAMVDSDITSSVRGLGY